VARIEELAGAIAEARGLKKQSIKQISSILTSELHRIFIQDENNWKKCNVGDVTEIIDPNPSHRMPNYCNSGIPFISTVDFEGSEDIRRTTAKYVMEEAYREQLTRCNFAPGDILYSRIGTIGLARLIDEVWPFALSHVLVVIKSHPSIIPRFLLWYLRSDSIISQAMEASRSIGTPDLGIKKIREFHMPLPPLGEQSEIAIKLDFLQTQVDALKRLQAETAAELDALLPSILDKAFKGKL